MEHWVLTLHSITELFSTIEFRGTLILVLITERS